MAMQALSKIVYVVNVEVDPEWEGELNRWYAEEHIPGLLNVPGILSARRYVAVDGAPKYFNFYEIDSLDTFHSPAREKAVNTPWTAKLQGHFTPRVAVYEQIAPAEGFNRGASWNEGQEGGLLVNRSDVRPEMEQEWNNWHNQEHSAALGSVEGNIAGRRLRVLEGQPSYMAMYHLTDPSVQASDAWKKAADTPWTARMRPATVNRTRMVYRPIPLTGPDAETAQQNASAV